MFISAVKLDVLFDGGLRGLTHCWRQPQVASRGTGVGFIFLEL